MDGHVWESELHCEHFWKTICRPVDKNSTYFVWYTVEQLRSHRNSYWSECWSLGHHAAPTLPVPGIIPKLRLGKTLLFLSFVALSAQGAMPCNAVQCGTNSAHWTQWCLIHTACVYLLRIAKKDHSGRLLCFFLHQANTALRDTSHLVPRQGKYKPWVQIST
jgi:hypothetical protein